MNACHGATAVVLDSRLTREALARCRGRLNARRDAGRRAVGSLDLLPRTDKVADETDKAIGRDEQGRPTCFLLLAPSSANDLVLRSAEQAWSIRQELPEPTRQAVLAPWFLEEVDGFRIAAYDYHQPLSQSPWRRRWEDVRLLPHVLAWQREAVRATQRVAEDLTAVEDDLAAFSTCVELPRYVRDVGEEARDALRQGRWQVRTAFMHNDLWRGNILRRDGMATRPPFVIIDWAGATTDGYPFYDTMRLLGSFSLAKWRSERAVSRLCDVLDCDAAAVGFYLAAALGRLRQNLDCFPYARFLQLTAQLFHDLPPCAGRRGRAAVGAASTP